MAVFWRRDGAAISQVRSDHQFNMKPHHRNKRRIRDLHYLDEEGMVACNPRDREAAHRAEHAGIATENPRAVTCKKCLEIVRKAGLLSRPQV